MTASLLLSTDEIPPKERGPLWCEWVWRHFGGLGSDLYGDSDFDGHLAASHAGDVILTRLEANRHRVVRTTQMARLSEAPYLKIVAPWQGSAEVTQRGRAAAVRSGGWTLYDTTADYTVANPERSDHLIVMLPKDQLASPALPLNDLVARRIGGASGISRVALETMRSTYLELPFMSEAARWPSNSLSSYRSEPRPPKCRHTHSHHSGPRSFGGIWSVDRSNEAVMRTGLQGRRERKISTRSRGAAHCEAPSKSKGLRVNH